MNCIILHKISGTDPQKETSLTLHLVKTSFDLKLREILTKLYDQLIDYLYELNESNVEDIYAESDNSTEKINDYYIRLKNKIPTTTFDNLENFFEPFKGDSFNSVEKIYQKFEPPPDGTLVAINYFDSYDRHYYIESQHNIIDELEITIHEH